MSTEPNIQTTSKKNFDWAPVKMIWDGVKFYSKTIIVLVFIINSVALALYGFELIEPSKQATAIMGSITAAFAAVVLFTFVHSGVKNQTKRKR